MLMDRKDKCYSSNPDFKFDEACLDVVNHLNDTVYIFGQYVECDKCAFQPFQNLTAYENRSILINTKYSMRMHFVHNGSVMCDWNQKLLEHYRYGWNISDKCLPLFIKEEADNAYIPILSAFIILFFFGTIWYMVKCIYKCTRGNAIWTRYLWNVNSVENDLGTSTETPLVIERPPVVKKHPNRIKSIDVFRGACIIVMIFVNYGGGEYWFFKHSTWNGLTVADLVFPWFLWLMGISMSISFHSKLRRAVPRRQLIIHVIKRSFILIGLGIVINSHGHVAPLSALRYLGVLQRIGLTYLIVGVLEAIFEKRVNEQPNVYLVSEVTSAWVQWVVMVTLLVVHTCITFLVNVPGCGKGYLGPGGLDDGGKFENCTGGVAGYIDRAVLGDHIYNNKHVPYKIIYEATQDIDPEGILGTLTSAFLVFLGVHAGRILNTYTNIQMRTIRWIIYGVIFGLLGGILCEFTKNGGPIPINKRLASLSFVFTLGGTAFIILAFLFVVIDCTRKWGGRPFFYPGMNPLAIYVLHEMFKNTYPVAWIPDSSTHAAYLGMNLWGTAFWVCVSIFLYKRNIFISL